MALCKNDGTVYKTENVASGSSYTLPSVRNASGYTFMGWDIQLGKSTAPRYEAGDTITVNSNIKLYAVVFNRSAEEDLTLSELLQSASSWKIGNGSNRGYNHIIFVGDSRTNRMQRTLQNLNSGYYESNLLRDIDFVYEEGKGLEWLKSQGMNTVLSIAEENYSVLKPTAVIFNLGVNDPGNMYDYISYYQEIAESLQKKNCKLFFMSVNPVNSKTIEYLGKNAIRKEEVIRKFNSVVGSALGSTFEYIDTYSYLMENGYGTNISGTGVDLPDDDGLHYTTKTYKRIFKYCLDYLILH